MLSAIGNQIRSFHSYCVSIQFATIKKQSVSSELCIVVIINSCMFGLYKAVDIRPSVSEMQKKRMIQLYFRCVSTDKF